MNHQIKILYSENNKLMEKVRISLLAVIFGSACFVLARTILPAPVTGKSTITSFVFPTAVPLPQWQPSLSRSLAGSLNKGPKSLSGRHYQYTQKNLTVDIEMRYMVKTHGNVKSFIEKYYSLPLSSGQTTLVLRQQEKIGFYNLFTYQQRAYLSSCINSRGGSTVTAPQFRRNRLLYDMHLSRLFPWLIGQGSVRDRRCLWAHLSVPLKNSSPEDAYRILETAWEPWYQWWFPRFPKPESETIQPIK